MFIVFWDTGSHILQSDPNKNSDSTALFGHELKWDPNCSSRVPYFILEIKHTRFITWLSQLMAAGEERENPGNYIYSPHGQIRLIVCC